MNNPILLGALLVEPLSKLNEGKGLNKDEFSVLNTDKNDVAEFWNGLNWKQKVEVGSAAIHFHLMTPNYKWKCHSDCTFDMLTKSQQRIVKFVFDKRETLYSMFYLPGLLKL